VHAYSHVAATRIDDTVKNFNASDSRILCVSVYVGVCCASFFTSRKFDNWFLQTHKRHAQKTRTKDAAASIVCFVFSHCHCTYYRSTRLMYLLSV
jgi:hypothetical protein